MKVKGQRMGDFYRKTGVDHRLKLLFRLASNVWYCARTFDVLLPNNSKITSQTFMWSKVEHSSIN